MERRKITLPLTRELARTLHAGDQVLLTGTIYTSRDAGHKRMCEALAKGEKIPFDPTDATIYYVGPTPAKPGEVIGSAGPTTSGRMDAYAPTMMSVGARGMIGKGARLPEVVDAMKKYDGVRSHRRCRSTSCKMHQKSRAYRLRRPGRRSTPQALCGRHAACSHH